MRRALFIAFAALTFGILHAESWDDRVVIYDMKEDPTLPTFVDNRNMTGFYNLELNDLRGSGAIYYRVGDVLYRADFDYSEKGPLLTLKIGKRRKKLVLEKKVLASGKTEETVYPPECVPEKGGWRRGANFGRHLVHPDDDATRRVIAGSTHLEFESTVRRCSEIGDCGASGCEEWGASTFTVVASTALKPVVRVSFSRALLEAKLVEQDFMSTYKNEIDSILPQTLGGLTATATGYHASFLPYPAFSDPAVEQRGFAIGVVFKRYASADKPEPVEVGIEPLMAEFQSPQPSKCGTWESGPNKTLFDLKGHPALFMQTPATGNSPASSSLYVCGAAVSISIETKSFKTQDEMTVLFDGLSISQIEQVAGVLK